MTLPKDRLSLLTLIAANFSLLVGVLWFGWDAALIVLVYWTENLIVGGYTVLRMLLAPVDKPIMHLHKLFSIPFFCLHFGGFCAVHGVFLLVFFDIGGGFSSVSDSAVWPGPLVFFGLLVSVVSTLWGNLPEGMALPVVCLIISHGISFVQNYLLGKERQSASIGPLMGRPYARIVLMHVALLAGGIPIMALGSPAPLVVILVLMKIGMDIWLHTRSHRVRSRRGRARGLSNRLDSATGRRSAR